MKKKPTTIKPQSASQRIRRAASALKTTRTRLYGALGNKGLEERGIRMGIVKAHKDVEALYIRIQRLAFNQEKYEREQRMLHAALPPTFSAEEVN